MDAIDDIQDDSLAAIITDPPFGEQQGFDGDGTLEEATNLFTNALKQSYIKMKQNAHVAFFWTLRNLDVAIDIVRDAGLMYRRLLLMYIPSGTARPYLAWLPRTQGIILAQKYLPKRPTDFHGELAVYLSDALSHSSFTRSSLAKALGCDSRLVMKWTRVGDPSWCLPTPRFYEPLKRILGLDDRYDFMLVRECSGGGTRNRTYNYQHDVYIVDNDRGPVLHPAQKPISVVRHLVDSLTNEGDLIFDPFAGSGTTLMAALELDRQCLGTEIDCGYYAVAIGRLLGYQVKQETVQPPLF